VCRPAVRRRRLGAERTTEVKREVARPQGALPRHTWPNVRVSATMYLYTKGTLRSTVGPGQKSEHFFLRFGGGRISMQIACNLGPKVASPTVNFCIEICSFRFSSSAVFGLLKKAAGRFCFPRLSENSCTHGICPVVHLRRS
jgi:hypothetical protein